MQIHMHLCKGTMNLWVICQEKKYRRERKKLKLFHVLHIVAANFLQGTWVYVNQATHSYYNNNNIVLKLSFHFYSCSLSPCCCCFLTIIISTCVYIKTFLSISPYYIFVSVYILCIHDDSHLSYLGRENKNNTQKNHALLCGTQK